MVVRRRVAGGRPQLGGCFPTASSQDEEKNPYFVAGKDRVAARDYQGAVEAFEKALKSTRIRRWRTTNSGAVRAARERLPAAIYHYNQVLKLRPQGAYPAENAKQRIPGCSSRCSE